MTIGSLLIDDYCFACGRKNSAGLKLNIQPLESEMEDTQKAHCTFTLDKSFQGYGGIIHGGILSTILDEVMIYALIFNEIPTMTAKLEVRFKAQAHAEEKMRAEARLIRDRGTMIEAEGRIVKDDGSVIAEAKGMFVKAKKIVRT